MIDIDLVSFLRFLKIIILVLITRYMILVLIHNTFSLIIRLVTITIKIVILELVGDIPWLLSLLVILSVLGRRVGTELLKFLLIFG